AFTTFTLSSPCSTKAASRSTGSNGSVPARTDADGSGMSERPEYTNPSEHRFGCPLPHYDGIQRQRAVPLGTAPLLRRRNTSSGRSAADGVLRHETSLTREGNAAPCKCSFRIRKACICHASVKQAPPGQT